MADDRDDRDGGHDDELSSALAVEPLDELTRRRLVARALAAADEQPQTETPARRGRGRIFAAVAAVIAVLAIGVTALSLPGGDTADVASRSAERERPPAAAPPATSERLPTGSTTEGNAADAQVLDPTSAGASAPTAGSGTALDVGGDVAGVPDLGEFGDLAVRGSRARILTAAAGTAAATGFAAGPIPADPVTIPCAQGQVAGLVATARGEVDGRPAIVVVTRRDDGSLRARALVADPCTVRRIP